MERGESEHMIAKVQASSPLLERVARTLKSPELRSEKAEAALDQASDMVELITQAALLVVGYHTHRVSPKTSRSGDQSS
jgi:hypothetical protein